MNQVTNENLIRDGIHIHNTSVDGDYLQKILNCYEKISHKTNEIIKKAHILLFTKKFTKFSIVSLSLLIPIILIFFNKLSSKKTLEYKLSLLTYSFLIPLYFTFCIIIWTILNFFHCYVFKQEYFYKKEKKEFSSPNSFIFNPLFYVAIIKLTNKDLVINELDKIYWASNSVIFDFIYIFTMYLTKYTKHNVSKINSFDEIKKMKSKIFNNQYFLILLNIFSMYFLNLIAINNQSLSYNVIFYFKAIYLFIIQVSCYFSIKLSFGQIDDSYIKNETNYFEDNKRKSLFYLLKYFTSFTVFGLIFLSSKKRIYNEMREQEDKSSINDTFIAMKSSFMLFWIIYLLKIFYQIVVEIGRFKNFNKLYLHMNSM